MTEELAREIRRKNYEFAYLLSPDLSEEDVRAWENEVLEWLAKNEGETKERQEARRQQLSYPIQHRKQAFFGFVRFNATTSTPALLREKIKYDEKVIRQLLVEQPKPLRQIAMSRRPMRRPMPAATPEATEAIDQQVEEAIAAAESATS